MGRRLRLDRLVGRIICIANGRDFRIICQHNLTTIANTGR